MPGQNGPITDDALIVIRGKSRRLASSTISSLDSVVLALQCGRR